ncbi:MAG: glycosyltransferase family 2 protein [Clostridiales bacterium]|nr:glycosyltransferase family 2 protein [Clostridiales bacterium]
MTLSLTVIVKNEEDVLARALSTAAVYADEIIIVDTGSTDKTTEVARRFTDKVYCFPWVDDFSAARNYAVSKSDCDYWMWLDADDIVSLENARKIARLKNSLDGKTDIIMLPYVLETDGGGKPIFSYYRERIIRKTPTLMWKGRVHEAVELKGAVVKKSAYILHAKPIGRMIGTRNLDIYKKMAADGEVFSPRDLYYYARELFYNGDFSAAAKNFRAFLDRPDGFKVNKVDACIMLSRCLLKLGDAELSKKALFESFVYGVPTGEACCEIGQRVLGEKDYSAAIYWFKCAYSVKPDRASGAFIDADCYGFLPFVWLTVCYDQLGDILNAYRYHLRAKKLRPDHPSVIANDKYFSGIFKK